MLAPVHFIQLDFVQSVNGLCGYYYLCLLTIRAGELAYFRNWNSMAAQAAVVVFASMPTAASVMGDSTCNTIGC